MKTKSEQMEYYLNGQLSPQEKQAFEKELEADQALFGEYSLRKDVDEAISDTQAMQLQKSMEQIMNGKSGGKQFWLSGKPLIYRIAAAMIAFLIVSSAVYFAAFANTQNDKLFTEYYQPSDAVMIVRSGNTDADKNLILGMQAYDAGDFDQAVKLLNSVNKNITAAFYSALSYIELKDYKEASQKLKMIVMDGDNLFIDQAEWYSALLLLKTGKKDEAIKSFIEISNSNSFYNIKASRVLVSLNN